MNRKTSIACAVIAGTLVILFSQAYVHKIEKINEESNKEKLSQNNQNMNISVADDNFSAYTDTPLLTDAIITDSNINVVITEAVTNEKGELISATTEKKSILEQANEKNTTQKQFNILNGGNKNQTITTTVVVPQDNKNSDIVIQVN